MHLFVCVALLIIKRVAFPRQKKCLFFHSFIFGGVTIWTVYVVCGEMCVCVRSCMSVCVHRTIAGLFHFKSMGH